MKYVCLVYHEEGHLDGLSDEALECKTGECGAWVAEMERGGHHVFSSGLQSVRTATTIRRRGGELQMTDGPFAETKEVLGGLTILEARDLNEALQLASKFPAATMGTVEVRPLFDLESPLCDPQDQRIARVIRGVASSATGVSQP